MSILLLIKHSLPDIVTGVPAAEWSLSDEGRRRCRPLAEKLRPYQPDLVASSIEPKAVQTAQLVAGSLELPHETYAGLHEHERRTVVFQGEREFQTAVAQFFAHPDELVFGEETAEQAEQRFTNAVRGLLARCPERSLAVVAHGTVITLLVAQACGIEPYPFWHRLGLPSFVVLSLPELDLLDEWSLLAVINEVA